MERLKGTAIAMDSVKIDEFPVLVGPKQQIVMVILRIDMIYHSEMMTVMELMSVRLNTQR